VRGLRSDLYRAALLAVLALGALAATFIESVTDPLYRPLFALAGATGMRRGEVAGLRRKDVDLDRGRINVRSNRVTVGYEVQEGSPKTPRSRRTITVGPNVVTMLAEYLRQHPMLPEALFFPVHPASITQMFDRAVARTELPRLRFHDLRHSHVAHLIEANVHPAKVSARLGHATVAYTFDRYGHLFPEADDEAAAVTDIAV
jgi:integrase